ncbi:MAG TPA: aldo/keto reductase, partial [Gammaproteobacteria bacterium]|nr:aldo/keto reductase [Gammaproteobacteria bacterium]
MDPFRLPSGERVARLGQGAWQIGEDRARRGQELAALRLGLELGLALIDTAELYGDGASEELVAEAIAGRRDRTYVVSKVLPRNASRKGTIAACERSLERLRTDYLDLYLLHWRESKPLAETLEAFVELADAGKIRHFGVSNFDVDDLEEARALPGGARVATDQVLYNLEHRGIEHDLLPWARERGMPVMAYSPLGSDSRSVRRLLGHRALQTIAARHSATPARVALAWLLARDGVITIPKASTEEHVRDNRAALDLRLAPDDLAELDRAFPPPRGKTSLAMI